VLHHPERALKDNPRFIITNLRQTPRFIYDTLYCARGDIENRLKELLLDLSIGRTSCSRFLANQFRVLLTTAAYVLLQEIRLAARHTVLARAQVATLRDRILKVGTIVLSSVRRLVFRLPLAFPYRDQWCAVARALGAG
jgi:hypothetical protein